MDFTSSKRRNTLIRFMKTLNNAMNIVNKKTNTWVFENVIDAFRKKYLASGVEGSIFKGMFKSVVNQKNLSEFQQQLVIKQVNLKAIIESKDISKYVINATPTNVYKLFLSSRSYNKPSLIEIIATTLTNQLVLQNVCQNFVLNYFWEYKDDKLISYNEYAQLGDLDAWAQEEHTVEEWFNLLFQVLAGLISMQKHFDMLHTDFHSKNILLQKVQPGGYWKYIIDGQKYYVPNLGFVVLITDLGFAWIPGKLQVGWHYHDTLSYITNVGKRMYDFSTFMYHINEVDEYIVPEYFKAHVSKSVNENDVNYIYTRRYHIRALAKSKEKSESQVEYLKKYPKVKKDYDGTGVTLPETLYTIFTNEFDEYEDMDFDTQKLMYTKKPEGLEKVLAVFDIDKSLDKRKFPSIMSDLVRV